MDTFYSRKFNQPISGTLSIEGLRLLWFMLTERNRRVEQILQELHYGWLISHLTQLWYSGWEYGPHQLWCRNCKKQQGIISPVKINDIEITGDWAMYKLPMVKLPLSGSLKCVYDNTRLNAAKLKVVRLCIREPSTQRNRWYFYWQAGTVGQGV